MSSLSRSPFFRIPARNLIALVVVALLCSSPAGVRAQTESVLGTSPLTMELGTIEAWDAPWQIESRTFDGASGLEAAGFTTGTSTLLVATVPGGYDIDEVRDALLIDLEGFGTSQTTIDRSSCEDISCLLDFLDPERNFSPAMPLRWRGP